jgi:hypothetical protein
VTASREEMPLDANPPRFGETVLVQHPTGTQRLGLVVDIGSWSPRYGYELEVVVPVVGRDRSSGELVESYDVTWRGVCARHVTDTVVGGWRWSRVPASLVPGVV